MAIRYVLLDGERRWRAAQLAGITELWAVVLDERPSAADLLVIQASIDVHRTNLRPMERSDLLARIIKETGLTVTEVGQKLGVKQAMASKLLAFQKLAPAVQAALDAGADQEKCYLISQEPDHAKQLELLKAAPTLSRDQVRQRAKGKTKPEAKLSSARFSMPGGYILTIQAKDLMSLADVIDVISETVKQLRRGLSQGMTLETQQKVMADQTKAIAGRAK
jgi:ParB family transcriptional regulator, chromosome partitioning protein